MMQVEIWALVNPTEKVDFIEKAIKNIFPDTLLEIVETEGQKKIVGHGDITMLKNMHTLLREEQIIDTARGQLEKSSERGSTQFMINKQVATVSRLNFPAVEEPLGSIHINIVTGSASELERLIDWLTPPTEDGMPLYEKQIPDI